MKESTLTLKKQGSSFAKVFATILTFSKTMIICKRKEESVYFLLITSVMFFLLDTNISLSDVRLFPYVKHISRANTPVTIFASFEIML